MPSRIGFTKFVTPSGNAVFGNCLRKTQEGCYGAVKALNGQFDGKVIVSDEPLI